MLRLWRLGLLRNAGLAASDSTRGYATKKGAITPKSKTNKGPQQAKGKKGAKGAKTEGAGAGGGGATTGTIVDVTIREPAELVEDHLFTGTRGVSQIGPEDINKYFHISEEDVNKYFPEGLPKGMVSEFQMSRSRFVQIRSSVLELINRLEFSATGEFLYTEPELLPTEISSEKKDKKAEKALRNKRHYILDGPVGCGKSFTLGVVVQWARERGWLVFYVPRAKEWTRGGYYYLNEQTGLWDIPVQAQNILKGFLDSHSELLEQIKCRVLEPIFLGEAAGLGRIAGPQEFTMPEGSTLKDLVEKGLDVQAAASNIVVRLRQELDLVEEVPVLIAVDEFNSWFTFTEFEQFLDFRKTRTIHAKELGMVSAFRKMETSPQHFIGAFSQSTVVGKLPLELPGAPKKYRLTVSRLDKHELNMAVQYYQRQNLLHREPDEDAINRLFYLTCGNGAELRKLVRYI